MYNSWSCCRNVRVVAGPPFPLFARTPVHLGLTFPREPPCGARLARDQANKPTLIYSLYTPLQPDPKFSRFSELVQMTAEYGINQASSHCRRHAAQTYM